MLEIDWAWRQKRDSYRKLTGGQKLKSSRQRKRSFLREVRGPHIWERSTVGWKLGTGAEWGPEAGSIHCVPVLLMWSQELLYQWRAFIARSKTRIVNLNNSYRVFWVFLFACLFGLVAERSRLNISERWSRKHVYAVSLKPSFEKSTKLSFWQKLDYTRLEEK